MSATTAFSLKKTIRNLDWSLIKGSSILTAGMFLARLLGLAYSLSLASLFSAGEYGQIRYAIAVSSIVAIGTMPFGQHVLSRFIGKHHQDQNHVDAIISNGLFLIFCIFLVSLLVAIPLLLITDNFNLGIIFIFLGETLFYTYWGVSSGFLAMGRLTAAYLGSNLFQLILVFVLIKLFGIQSPTLAISIYGLSYLLPLWVLIQYWPLSGKFEYRLIARKVMNGLLRFSLPVWISHLCYTLSISVDFLFMEKFRVTGELGAYSFAKTLAGLFLIIPTGVSTFLMPKVAGSTKERPFTQLGFILVGTILLDAVLLSVFLPFVHPVTGKIFGSDYLVPFIEYVLLAGYMILYGIHGLVSAVWVGVGKPYFESISRIVELVATILFCWMYIPADGGIGAAKAILSGKIAGLLVYMFFGLTQQLEQSALFKKITLFYQDDITLFGENQNPVASDTDDLVSGGK